MNNPNANPEVLFGSLNPWLVLVASLLGMMISLAYIMLFLSKPKLHKSPGDIYLGMSVAEGLLAFHQFLTSLWNIVTDDGQSAQWFCYVNSPIATLAVVLLYTYSLQLYIHMVVRLQFALKSKRIQKWKGHVYSWSIAIIYCLDLFLYKQYEIDKQGYCGTVLSGYTPYTFLIFILVYIMIAISAMVYLKHEAVQNSQFKKPAQKFINFLSVYMIIQLSLSIIVQLCITVVGISYQYKTSIPRETFKVCIAIAEGALLLLPIVFPLSRLLDPDLRRKILPQKQASSQPSYKFSDTTGIQVSRMMNKSRLSEKIQLAESMSITVPKNGPKVPEDRRKTVAIGIAKSQNVITGSDSFNDFALIEHNRERRTSSFNKGRARTVQRKRRNSEESLGVRLEQNPFMHVLSSSIRSLIMKRILCFLNLHEKDKLASSMQQRLSGFKRIVKKGKSHGFHDRHIYIQSAVEMINMFGYAFVDTQVKSVSHKFYNMISYAQSIFDIIMVHDLENVDIMNSLDLMLNEAQIEECSQTTGGKSGEFFFFTHDNRFLLKTVSIYEQKILLKRLENYFWHVTNHTETLIAKIMGVFTFEGFETGPIQFVLMKNVAKCPKFAIERVYDIKGSSYDREVLRKPTLRQSPPKSIRKVTGESANIQQSMQSDNLSSRVLKDKDFVNLEERIHIEQKDVRRLLQQIEEDSSFLKQQGLMDYSLIVFKINWQSVCKLTEQTINDQQLMQAIVTKRTQGIQHCYRSTQEDGIYYHIGIIDYLQTYNTKKVLEKYAKRVIKFNAKLDTSSQDPKTYQIRFVRFLQTIL